MLVDQPPNPQCMQFVIINEFDLNVLSLCLDKEVLALAKEDSNQPPQSSQICVSAVFRQN